MAKNQPTKNAGDWSPANMSIKGEDFYDIRLNYIPSGSYMVDALLGGGYPAGITVFYGQEGIYKTTLAAYSAVKATENGGAVLWFNVEAKGDFKQLWERVGGTPELAKKVGYYRASYEDPKLPQLTFERVMNIILDFAGNCPDDVLRKSLVVIDGFNVLMPAAIHENLDRTAFSPVMALRNTYGTAIAAASTSRNFAIVIISQARQEMDAMTAKYYNEDRLPGGYWLKHAASRIVHFDLNLQSKASTVYENAGYGLRNNSVAPKSDDIPVGHAVKLRLEKGGDTRSNRVVKVPFRSAKNGTITPWQVWEIAEAGIAAGIIVQSGAYYTFKDVKVQGASNLLQELDRNRSLLAEISAMLHGNTTNVIETTSEEDEQTYDS